MKKVLFTIMFLFMSFLCVNNVEAAELKAEYKIKYRYMGTEIEDVWHVPSVTSGSVSFIDGTNTTHNSSEDVITKEMLNAKGITDDSSTIYAKTFFPIGWTGSEFEPVKLSECDANGVCWIDLSTTSENKVTINIKDSDTGAIVSGETTVKIYRYVNTSEGWEEEWIGKVNGSTTIPGFHSGVDYKAEITKAPTDYYIVTNSDGYYEEFTMDSSSKSIRLDVSKQTMSYITIKSSVELEDGTEEAVPITVEVNGEGYDGVEYEVTNNYKIEVPVGIYTVKLVEYPSDKYRLTHTTTEFTARVGNIGAIVSYDFEKIGSSSGGTNDDDDSDSSGGTTDDEDEIIKVTLVYKNDGNEVPNIQWKLYGNSTCTGTAIASGKALTKMTIFKDTYSGSKMCLKTITSSIPSKYELADADDEKYIFTAGNKNIVIDLVKVDDSDSGSGDSSDEENTEQDEKIEVQIGYFYTENGEKKYKEDFQYSLSENGCSGDVFSYSTSAPYLRAREILATKKDLCLITNTIPDGWQLVNAEDANYEFELKEGNVVEIEVKQTDGTVGSIKVNFMDEDEKQISGVKYNICKDAKCQSVLYSENPEGSFNNIPIGTYYLVVKEVPKGFVLPKDAIKITLTKDNNNASEKIVLAAQTAVPDTLLDVSKLITICGALGMVAGISLLYFNSKKKEQEQV